MEATRGNKKAKCLGDLLTAQYIQFNGSSRLYVVSRNEWDEVRIMLDDAGEITTIGRIKLHPKGIKIEVSRYGIKWESVLRYSEINCIGTKKPRE